MRIAAEKTDRSILRVDSDAIAIRILPGRRDDRPHWNILEFADPLESVTNLSPLDSQLMLVANVLVSASATAAEIRTLWFHAMRRTFLDLDQLRFGELFFLAQDFGGSELAFDRVRNKDGLASFSGDAFSPESNIFDS